ncbi:accessory Sec system translocase SecA2 [Tessaracoccus antarcticus]|uniref:Protein translocase subunit SecA n=1 Tax=Tessaracoccus antarcticus TaxID=2479848 RepID=A0A3M0G4X9_9ACTN|nr:accessory Sec system translocase SecA2 [Tessaracoccus antarcticus]RMB60070.1 accessory Sec system translocase SecA2 [Tessaracoccus antarcticus]
MRDWLEPVRDWFHQRPAAAEVAALAAVVRASGASNFEDWSEDQLLAASRKLSVDTRVGLAAYLAISRELAARTVGLRPFDVQLQAAAAMLRGVSMEMDTGEGKTLVGAIVAAGHALSGSIVHVLSANEYLARRDAAWMAPFFASLQLTVGVVTADTTPSARRRAYGAHITYVPVSEAGFDILRDRLAHAATERVRSTARVAILDEADAVLLDEGRTPLVLAGESDTAPAGPTASIGEMVATLVQGRHYEVDVDRRSLHFTDEGFVALEEWFTGVDLFGDDHEVLAEAHVALHAEVLLVRDVDYVIRGGRAWMVSQARGRIEQLQRWPEGLQSAIEAKEGLSPSPALDVLDQITMADLLGEYRSVVGMSATLVPASEELQETHGLKVGRLPPNEPCVRQDEPGRLFRTAAERDAAALDLLVDAHATGQPVLVATQSVAMSEAFAARVVDIGLPVAVLNALNDEREATIIARAGEPGRITVSTQMAGRGTDIRPSHESRTSGGLLIVGLGIFPSKRLEDQIRGRSGRQGDPGRSVFLWGLDDELIHQAAPGHKDPQQVTVVGEVLDPRLRQLPNHAQQVSDGAHASLRGLTQRYGRLLGLQRRKLLGLREEWLTQDTSILEVLSHDSALQERLSDAVSEAEMVRAMRRALLSSVDRAWSEHLGYATSVREGIHLRVLVKEDPLDEFNRILAKAWPSIVPGSIENALRIVALATVRDGRLDLEGAGLHRPSATWAYTVTDNSLGTEGERLAKALFKSMRFPRRF